MTDRWLNYALAVVVLIGLVGVTFYQRPRLAEERAELLDQEVVAGQDAEEFDGDRDPIELRSLDQDAMGEDDAAETDEAAEDEETEDAGDDAEEPTDDADEPAEDGSALGAVGITSSHPAAVEAGMTVLEAGGNAVDAVIAAAYMLGVAEPFGSGPGGGGAMLLHQPGEEPLAYDYRETVPVSGEVPVSDIGIPGFVAGMEHIHEQHGSIELADLIEPAARRAEEGYEVNEYLHDRLTAAAARLPIHLAPRFFPGGAAIDAGEILVQPEYAEALRLIQDEGADAMYGGALGEEMADAISGMELADIAEYEVEELEPTVGTLGRYEVIGGAAPTSGATVVQIVQIADALGYGDMDPRSAEAHHAVAQAWRLALADRTELIGDPTVEDIPLPDIIERDHTDELAALVPEDGFADIEDGEPAISPETDTTHLVVVDADGNMASMTNTLSNFFGSGLPVSGFFMNDQLKNFSPVEDSVNHPAPGKRPRSFVAPMILADDDRPVLGIGSPGGRRIPMMTAQVLLRYALLDEDLETATMAPRFHLEGERVELEEALPGDVSDELHARGYAEVTTQVPVTEYFGGMQALTIDHDAGTLDGIADERRPGTWEGAREGESSD